MKERSGLNGKMTALIAGGIALVLGLLWLASESGDYRKNKDRRAAETDAFIRQSQAEQKRIELEIQRERLRGGTAKTKEEENAELRNRIETLERQDRVRRQLAGER